MTTYGASIIGRNDDYGQNLLERATYCLNSMLTILDEVIYVDWNTEEDKLTLVEEIKKDLVRTDNLKYIRVYPEQAKKFINYEPDAQAVVETHARNIGIRRLSTDFLISTNIDMIAPQRRHLERVINTNVFYTTGMRPISLYVVRTLGDRTQPNIYMANLEPLESSYPQQPPASVHWNDRYSLVSNCGDFQIAHRNIWYKIRGFEERFTGRAFMDSNIQMKASLYGYGIAVDWNLPVWHIGHEGGYGGCGKINNMDEAFTMTVTTNVENWGHYDSELELLSL